MSRSSKTTTSSSSSSAEDTTELDPSDVSISEVGKQFPRIVDVSWRLSLITNTSTAKKVLEPVFLVQLTVSDGGELREIQFSCNSEEMNDFVQKLKEATAQIDRTSSGKA